MQYSAGSLDAPSLLPFVHAHAHARMRPRVHGTALPIPPSYPDALVILLPFDCIRYLVQTRRLRPKANFIGKYKSTFTTVELLDGDADNADEADKGTHDARVDGADKVAVDGGGGGLQSLSNKGEGETLFARLIALWGKAKKDDYFNAERSATTLSPFLRQNVLEDSVGCVPSICDNERPLDADVRAKLMTSSAAGGTSMAFRRTLRLRRKRRAWAAELMKV